MTDRTTREHGSLRGAWQHQKRGETLCPECRPFHNAWQRDYRKRVYVARGPMLVSSVPTRRRVQALARMGWPLSAIGELLGGVSDRAVGNMISPLRQQTHRATEAKVTALFERLCMTPGPSGTAALRAERKGWAGPLEWDNIEDPDEVPANVIEAAHAEAIEEDRRWRKRQAKQAKLDAMSEAERAAFTLRMSEYKRSMRQRAA